MSIAKRNGGDMWRRSCEVIDLTDLQTEGVTTQWNRRVVQALSAKLNIIQRNGKQPETLPRTNTTPQDGNDTPKLYRFCLVVPGESATAHTELRPCRLIAEENIIAELGKVVHVLRSLRYQSEVDQTAPGKVRDTLEGWYGVLGNHGLWTIGVIGKGLQ